MKQTVVDVLMYLFESYMDDDQDSDPDRDALESRLVEAGFQPNAIEKAFDWLEDLDNYPGDQELTTSVGKSTRLYHSSEMEKLNRECRGFLMFLEQADILLPASRELVIDRVMALDTDEIDLEQFKWVVMMVLFNLPGDDATHNWLENLVLDEPSAYLH
jgi:Smg protein